jgi:hypothetical protein
LLTMSTRLLQLESATHRGSGGVSGENRGLGFTPAFLDTHSGSIYLSSFANGCPAPVHVLDGIPDELVVARDRRGRATQVVGTIVAGFVRESRFYTRAEAAACVAEHDDALLAC